MKATHRFSKSRLVYTHYNKAFIAHNLEEYRLISAHCLINQYKEKIRLADDTACYIIVETPKYESLHPTYTIPIFEIDFDSVLFNKSSDEYVTKECLDFVIKEM